MFASPHKAPNAPSGASTSTLMPSPPARQPPPPPSPLWRVNRSKNEAARRCYAGPRAPRRILTNSTNNNSIASVADAHATNPLAATKLQVANGAHAAAPPPAKKKRGGNGNNNNYSSKPTTKAAAVNDTNNNNDGALFLRPRCYAGPRAPRRILTNSTNNNNNNSIASVADAHANNPLAATKLQVNNYSSKPNTKAAAAVDTAANNTNNNNNDGALFLRPRRAAMVEVSVEVGWLNGGQPYEMTDKLTNSSPAVVDACHDVVRKEYQQWTEQYDGGYCKNIYPLTVIRNTCRKGCLPEEEPKEVPEDDKLYDDLWDDEKLEMEESDEEAEQQDGPEEPKKSEPSSTEP